MLDQPTALQELEERPAAAEPARRLVLAAVMMAIFMAAIDLSIVATAMPTIVAELGGFHLFSWTFAAYLLAQAVTIPIYGRLADLYGRKRVFFAGASLFLAGSTLCGLAWGMVPLVLFRALQGAGAGAIQPIATTIVGDIYTPAERARVQGYISGVWGVAAIIARRSAPSSSSMPAGRSSFGSICRSGPRHSSCSAATCASISSRGGIVSTTAARS